MDSGTIVPSADGRAPRRWGRSAQTRTVILEAAREVFLEHGFAEAAIAHVVERSGCSVGSIYHHFGGKAELYIALWETHQRTFSEAANEAVAARRRAGEEDTVELFLAGARAYLEMAWAHHDMAQLFLAGDGPPGFETLQRKLGKSWVHQNSALLGADEDDPHSRVLVMVLTSIVGESARELGSLDSRSEAQRMIETCLSFIRKVTR